MRDLRGKAAVITGAASGIGKAMAQSFAAENMKLVLADIEEKPLADTKAALEKDGAEVLAVVTDVSSRESVQALADAAFDTYNNVHILCNNAGVSGGSGHVWTIPLEDWEWILSVNLMGVVHGVQVFVPPMIEHDDEGVVINTSSVVGLTTGSTSVYGVTKHAITRLTEGLHYDLRAAKSQLRAAVLCPGMVATNILSADRNRPDGYAVDYPEKEQQARTQRRQMMNMFMQQQGMKPEKVGDIVVQAIKDEQFYIFTHHENLSEKIRLRMENILEQRTPSPDAAL